MMTKHFLIGLIVTSVFLAAPPGSALARRTVRILEPPVSKDISAWVGESGIASYYGPAHHGRRTADGTRFDQMALTAAHRWLPFGTKVKVTLAGTRRTVIVTITDRLSSGRRIVDLSVAAAMQLGMISRGTAEVSLLPV
jgi:rare lipoprotein A